ncbi:MAG: hypothetical protein OK474_02140 [Thaumarchaeota archaeon]|nr:hypothetical protein [Nitrososphaerota archaeon]
MTRKPLKRSSADALCPQEEPGARPGGLKGNVKAYEEAGFDWFVAFGCMGEFYASNFEEFKNRGHVRRRFEKIACVFGTTLLS